MWNHILSTIKAHDSPDISSSRVVLIITTIAVVSVWAFLSIKNNIVTEIPMGVVSLNLGLAGFKTVQRFGETGKLNKVLGGVRKMINKTKKKYGNG